MGSYRNPSGRPSVELATLTFSLAVQRGVRPPGDFDGWMYLGTDALWRTNAERSLLADLPRISTADEVQSAAAALRRPYLDTVGTLSAMNDSLEWWACEVAAKSAFSRVFDRLCSVRAFAVLAQQLDGATLVVCESAGLLDAVAVVAGELGLDARRVDVPPSRDLRRASVVSLASRAPGPLLPPLARLVPSLDLHPRFRRRVLERFRAGVPPLAGERTALIFTWVDERSFAGDGTYVDPHFGQLPEQLAADGWDVGLVARVIAPGFRSIARRLYTTGQRCYFPEGVLHISDWRSALARASAWSPQIPPDLRVDNVPFVALATETVEEFRWSQALALAYEPLVRRLAEAGVRPARVFHTFEGHNWEQVMTESARLHTPDTTIVGYENLNMTRFALSMFPAASEFELRPLPDRVVTNGAAYRRVLVEEGWPSGRVREGCGLRHASLTADRRRRSTDRLCVLVATDATLAGSVELVDKALGAFGGSVDADLRVKVHPLLDSRLVVEATGVTPAMITGRPIAELLAEADLMLYTYSAVAYDALACGVPPVFVRSETLVDLDQLEPFAELRWSARTPAELRAAVAEIRALEEPELRAWRERAQRARFDALNPVEPPCFDAFMD